MRFMKVITSLLWVTLIFVVDGCGTSHTSKGSTQPAISQSVHEASSNSINASNSTETNSSGILTVGKQAPDETLTFEKTMKRVRLASFFGKKPLIINAWASWCPPCQEETPNLVKMYGEYHSKVQFIGVNLTTLDSVKNATSFVKKYAIPFPILLDTKGSFYMNYSVIAEPMTYVISPTGKVLAIHMGALSTSQIRQLIQVALSDRQV